MLVNMHPFPHASTSAITYTARGEGRNGSSIAFVSYVAGTQRSGRSLTCLPVPGSGATARLQSGL